MRIATLRRASRWQGERIAVNDGFSPNSLVSNRTIGSVETRVLSYLSGQVDDLGRARGACCSRVLESALACRLLEWDGGYPKELARVRRWLDGATAAADLTALDRLLLGLANRDPLAMFEHHTAERKRLLVSTILLCAGVDDSAGQLVPDHDILNLHTWKQTEMLAIRVVHARAHHSAITDDQLDTLAARVHRPAIDEGNHLSHLLCLHALHTFPTHRSAVRHGLDLLLATQQPDGGFSVATDFDTWVTSIVATALAESDADPKLLARMATWLITRQHFDGGWSYRPGTAQTDMDTTYTALAFLGAYHVGGDSQRHMESAIAGRAYVRRMQNTDGGWPTYRRGNPSEAAMTGGALVALAQSPDTHAAAIQAGVAWLAHVQQADGTFERGWSRAETNALFRVAHGLLAARGRVSLPKATARAADETLDRIATYLSESRNHDGGWGHRTGSESDPISTGYAMAALGGLQGCGQLPEVVGYLAQMQQPDGSFSAPADTVAPRPIPIQVPLLAPAYVLRGLTACHS
jgi:squalene-hopene/tetraprenyl-beta-curcumene cyclase